MDDLLSRALTEAPKKKDARARSDVAEHPTRECHTLSVLLEALQAQLRAALDLPFFDGGTSGDTTPVVKNGHAELGTTRVFARKREPAYEATASVEVHCDHDLTARGSRHGGSYLVRARANVRCEDARGRAERDLVFAVHEIGGALEVDAADLRAKIAEAIGSIGKAP